MKRTFTTIMPNQIGAFLAASKIFTELQLNITRVSYNKAVDEHTLFIEVDGAEDALQEATDRLKEIGYLPDTPNNGSIIVVEFRLPDRPGALLPVLELIHQYQLNISYMSAQENKTPYQYFRMGLFAQREDGFAPFLTHVAQICDVQIMNYNPTGFALDNTVFYVSFANGIAEELGLGEVDKRQLMIDSNLVMELLTRRNSPPYKTFDYIGRFAAYLKACRGAAYVPRITRYDFSKGEQGILIEPPCGSNLWVIETDHSFLCVDGGFPCFQKESLAVLQQLYPNFDRKEKILLLTHADVDHCGLIDAFDKVYVSQKCLTNFMREKAGENNLREENPIHAPYVRISKILAGYHPYSTDNLSVIGGTEEAIPGLAAEIGKIEVDNLLFEVYEMAGGHVKGETLYIERRLGIVFTGDIFVNVKEFTKEQAAFNRLAPYLMTSVDTDPALAARERSYLEQLLGPGQWLIFGGHGRPKPITVVSVEENDFQQNGQSN